MSLALIIGLDLQESCFFLVHIPSPVEILHGNQAILFIIPKVSKQAGLWFTVRENLNFWGDCANP